MTVLREAQTAERSKMNPTNGNDAAVGARTAERHPPGLYVLFATEMWARFSFYSMLAMFTLYLRAPMGAGLRLVG